MNTTDHQVGLPQHAPTTHPHDAWDKHSTSEPAFGDRVARNGPLLRLCLFGSLPIGVTAAIFAVVVFATDVFDAIHSRAFQTGHAVAIAASMLSLLHCITEVWRRASVWVWLLTSLTMAGAIWSLSSQLNSTPPEFLIVSGSLAIVSLGIVRAIRVFDGRLRNAPLSVLILAVIASWWWLMAVLVLPWFL